MTPSRRFPSRLAMTLVGLVAVLVVGAASALGQSAPSAGASSPTGGGRFGTGASSVSSAGALAEESGTISVGSSAPTSVMPSIASPVTWCCTTGSVPGLTVMGQATIKDRGEAARDAAIAEAVVDAMDQANAAADAAGIQLGAVLDLEVSAMPIVYPMEEIAPPNAGIAAGSAGGSTQGASGPVTIDPVVPVDQYLGSVTVTITWAIG